MQVGNIVFIIHSIVMCCIVFQCNLLYRGGFLSAAGQDMIFLCIEQSSFPSVVIEEEERGAHLQNYNKSSE